MGLPILTTSEDVKGIVDYLRTKPTGATLAEARAVVGKNILDGRKIAAYQVWGFVLKDAERLKLTPRGWEMARKSKSESDVFREVVSSISAYLSVLEWMHHQNMKFATNVDVAAHWHEHHKDACGTNNENTIKDQAVCFFHVAQAAALGTLTIGRRGQPTRLELDRTALKKFAEGGPTAPPWLEPETQVVDPAEPTPNGVENLIDNAKVEPPINVIPASTQPQKPELSIFIAHGKNMDIVDQVQTLLDMADIKGEVAEAEESAAIPVPEKVLTAMRRCNAGIIIVSVEERRKDADGHYAINENVLIEVGAAFVLYDKRVVLVWDKRLPVPSNLQGLYRCEFEGNELSWTAGTKLMKAIKGFKQA
jgi:hypothetical protein